MFLYDSVCKLMDGTEELLNAAINMPPSTTALGALLNHITGGANAATFQPMNVNFGLFQPLEGRVRKDARPQAYSSRALNDLAAWQPHQEAA